MRACHRTELGHHRSRNAAEPGAQPDAGALLSWTRTRRPLARNRPHRAAASVKATAMLPLSRSMEAVAQSRPDRHSLSIPTTAAGVRGRAALRDPHRRLSQPPRRVTPASFDAYRPDLLSPYDTRTGRFALEISPPRSDKPAPPNEGADRTGLEPRTQKACKCRPFSGRYWARTSDLRLVEAALSQLS
jgi:hypothetical protein